MSEQTEKLSSPLGVLPEPEHNAFEPIFYRNQHVLGWILFALGSATRVLAGSINAGQIQGLKVLFNLSDGTREVISFANTDISVGDNRKVYYADYVTETILSVELPGFESFIPDENEFPIVHAVRYQDTAVTTADRLEWIAPRTDIYGHVPLGKIIALHPYAPDPDTYFFKFCDGTGTLGINFPGHESDTIPNLTDDRFLMGGTVYGTGGSNFLLDHTHGFSLTAAGQGGGSHAASFSLTAAGQGGGSHSHTTGASVINTSSIGNNVAGWAGGLNSSYVYPGVVTFATNAVSHSHNASGVSGSITVQSHTHNSSSVSGSVGSGSAPTATSSLPKYFTTKFYLKIN